MSIYRIERARTLLAGVRQDASFSKSGKQKVQKQVKGKDGKTFTRTYWTKIEKTEPVSIPGQSVSTAKNNPQKKASLDIKPPLPMSQRSTSHPSDRGLIFRTDFVKESAGGRKQRTGNWGFPDTEPSGTTNKSKHRPNIQPRIEHGYVPKKTIKVYKLFSVDPKGLLTPTQTGKDERYVIGQWYDAHNKPRKDLAERAGLHASSLPIARQMRQDKDKKGDRAGSMSFDRVWAEIEMPDDYDWHRVMLDEGKAGTGLVSEVPNGGHYWFNTGTQQQGVPWLIAGQMKVTKILTNKEVSEILEKSGYPDDALKEQTSDDTIEKAKKRCEPR